MSKLQQKPSFLRKEHPSLQKMNLIDFLLILWVIFSLLEPDPDCESGSGFRDPIENGSRSESVSTTLNKVLSVLPYVAIIFIVQTVYFKVMAACRVYAEHI
jgi:hypothetical protein